MGKAERTGLVLIVASVLLGVLLAAAGSQGSHRMFGLPAFALAVAMSFVIQWVVFIPSYLRQTEHYFDLTGSLSFIAVTILLLVSVPGVDARGWLLASLVLIWAGRLGSFLFLRVRRAGADDRFDAIKPSPIRFLGTWTTQGAWVSFTAAAAWIAITSTRRVALDGFAVVGALVWLAGFGIEVVADRQKSAFRAQSAHVGRFIDTGLWSWSRHPNYLGEILAWIGVSLIALPTFSGWQFIGLSSPVFVALLITKVSGIPLLEAKADAKWGGQADYEAYKRRTPVLVPRPLRAR